MVEYGGKCIKMNDLKEIIASNIIKLRKDKKLTQLEFATKINYSDKAISKWERAESIPDVIVLKQIADLFGVSVDYLLSEHSDAEKPVVVEEKKSRYKVNKIPLTLLASSPIWVIATVVFTLFIIFKNQYLWYLLYACIPLTLLIVLIFNSIFGNKKMTYFIVSCFIWSILICLYLAFITYNPWQLFIIGIPAQVVIILCSMLVKKRMQ